MSKTPSTDDKNKLVIFIGTIDNRFKKLFAKIKKLNSDKKYTAVFCVGNSFSGKDNDSEWDEVKTEGCDLPLFIYGPHTLGSSRKFTKGQIAPNVFYVDNKFGTFKFNGLKIAYVCGSDVDLNPDKNDVVFNTNDVVSLAKACINESEEFRGIDILLTYDVPAGFQVGIANSSKSNDNVSTSNPPKGSNKLAWLTYHLKPQYVLCGKGNLSYEGRPYVNQYENKEHITKFITVNNFKLFNQIIAYSITPINQLSNKVQQIFDLPPFQSHHLEIGNIQTEDDKPQSFFYATNSSHENKQYSRKRKYDGNKQKQKGPMFDVNNCWFCLSNENIEKYLIITMGNDMYVVRAKGGVTSDHLIILPIRHYQSSLDISKEAEIEMEKYKEALRDYFKTINKVPIFFERNFKNFHFQLHVIPIPESLFYGIKPIFQDAAEEENLEFIDLPPKVHLTEVIEKKLIETQSGNKFVNPPYFYLEISKDIRMFILIQNNTFPLEFGRETLVSKSLLNMPDRTSWKSCVLDDSKESVLTTTFRNDFAPFHAHIE